MATYFTRIVEPHELLAGFQSIRTRYRRTTKVWTDAPYALTHTQASKESYFFPLYITLRCTIQCCEISYIATRYITIWGLTQCHWMDGYYVPTTKMDRYLKQVIIWQFCTVNLYKSVIIIIIETKLCTALFSRIEITFLSVGFIFSEKNSLRDFPRARIYAETFNISNTCLPESRVFFFAISA